MKYFLLFFLLTSCQNKVIIPNSQKNSLSEDYQAQIKADKKRQAELDLPFRGFNADKNIKTIAFGSPETNCWEAIGKNNPELMILTSTPDKNLSTIPEYRSIREKVPFMCSPSTETKLNFIRSWPYVKTIIPDGQEGAHHAKIFGTKKNQLQVIMIDQFDSDVKWTWLENEFKKPTALKILAGPTQYREKMLSLIKKAKTKNVILLPNDRSVGTFEKVEKIRGFSVYEALTAKQGLSGEPEPVIFGLIKIDWEGREAQLEIRTIDDQKLQGVELKF